MWSDISMRPMLYGNRGEVEIQVGGRREGGGERRGREEG